jgi:2-dehydro-3-deoxygluconokinase
VARDAGVLVSFDLNFRGNLWSREGAGNVYRDLIPLMDIVFAGEDEAAIAVGAGEPQELARRIATLGPSQAVIKLGADGALAFADGEMFHQGAIAVSVVDTVGAGDAFVAGYLAELMEGRAPEERLRTAVATGAFACLVPGDWEGFPRRHELVLLEAKEPVSR